MSHFRRARAGLVVLSGLGALVQPKRRRDWLLVGAGAVAAHAAAIMIKLVVRRARPNHPAIAVNVATPSALSFPSAHATSTTAAAMFAVPGHPVTAAAGAGARDGPVAAGARVHYPTDVLAGAAVGAAVAQAAARLAGRSEGDAW